MLLPGVPTPHPNDMDVSLLCKTGGGGFFGPVSLDSSVQDDSSSVFNDGR